MAQDDLLNMGNPGYTVAATLQNILAQKRADARQAMLDDLTQQKTQAEIEDHAASVKSQTDTREANAEDRQSRVAERNRVAAASAARQKALTDAQATDWYKAASPQMQLGIRLAGMEGGDPTLFNTMLSREMAPQKPAMIPRQVYHADTDSFSDAVDAHGQPILGNPGENPVVQPRTPREPREPQDHGTFIDKPVLDADGNQIPGKAYVMLNGKLTIQDVAGAGVIPAKASKPFGIAPVLQTKLQKLREDLERSRGSSWNPLGNGEKGDPTKRSLYVQGALGAIANSGLSSDAIEAVTDLLNDPNSDKKKTSDINVAPFSASDQKILLQVLPGIRGL